VFRLRSNSEYSAARAAAALATAILLLGIWPSQAAAQSPHPSHEVWVGAYAAQTTWFAYTGGTTAPFGDLDHDGFRLRAVAGHGEYRFEGFSLVKRGRTLVLDRIAFRDRVTFTDALAGYMMQIGALTAKGFAGLAFVDHDVSAPPGFLAATEGTDWGAKVQIELWYDDGGPFWSAVNAGYTTAQNSYSINVRGGIRLGDSSSPLSVGTELTIDNHGAQGPALTGAYARGGAFVRYAWDSGEISLSGGLIADLDDEAGLIIEEQYSTYGGLSILTKF